MNASIARVGPHTISRTMQQWLGEAEAALKMPLGNLIISGYRSREFNKELQDAWDQGWRDGLDVRPADNSFHLTGDAVDLLIPNETLLKQLVKWWEARGGKWGGRWIPSDPNHFQLPYQTITSVEINLV
tara:strand:+ start:1113 stop:1499 length:387 start_codon:yes stop_codon:yes gene_type:complete